MEKKKKKKNLSTYHSKLRSLIYMCFCFYFKKSVYFTIQYIFAIIYKSHGTF